MPIRPAARGVITDCRPGGRQRESSSFAKLAQRMPCRPRFDGFRVAIEPAATADRSARASNRAKRDPASVGEVGGGDSAGR